MSDDRQHVNDTPRDPDPRRPRPADHREGAPERYPPVRRDDSVEGLADDDLLPGAESDA